MTRRRGALAIILAALLSLGGLPAFADDVIRYEYKIVSLGSLSALQEKSKSEAKMGEIEKILNKEGLEGWEIVNIFAVRTTFDPNVFFAAMQRPVANNQPEEGK